MTAENTDKTDEVIDGEAATATDETTDTDNVADDTNDDDIEKGAEALGDPGKKALDAMKAKWKSADAAAKETAAKLAALEAKVNGTEAEHAAATERERVQSEAIAKANARLVRAEVRTAAKGRLSNADDAFAFIDISQVEVNDDGDIDTSAVTALIDDLIAERPYLAAATAPRFEGGADAGAKNVTGPKQWTQADMDKATPAEILAAHKAGLLKSLMG
ncbi:hypothetical protein [Microbacterium sp. GXF6406]